MNSGQLLMWHDIGYRDLLMQSRARAGEGPSSGPHPTAVELKNADDRPRQAPGRDFEPVDGRASGWLRQLFARSKPSASGKAVDSLLAFASDTTPAAAPNSAYGSVRALAARTPA